jgi:hypothetical protein
MVINTSFPITFTNSPLADSVKHKPWKQLVFLSEALALAPRHVGSTTIRHDSQGVLQSSVSQAIFPLHSANT